MNIHGSRTLEVRRAELFEAIFDPAMLLAVIPGCREIERVDETEYRGLISLRLPGLVGAYRTVVRVAETDPPTFGRLGGEIVGALGSIRGTASFRLAVDGPRTTVDYVGAGVIDGPLARLDGRFVESLAGSLINQGLGNLEWRLQATPSRRASGVPG